MTDQEFIRAMEAHLPPGGRCVEARRRDRPRGGMGMDVLELTFHWTPPGTDRTMECGVAVADSFREAFVGGEDGLARAKGQDITRQFRHSLLREWSLHP